MIYLREWREFRGLTQERLAERLETTNATISRWENGKVPWNSDQLAALADALSVEAADLFRDPAKPEFQAWQIITGLRPETQRQALAVLEALAQAEEGKAA